MVLRDPKWRSRIRGLARRAHYEELFDPRDHGAKAGETRFALSLPLGITTGLTLFLQVVTTVLGDVALQRIEKLSDTQEHFGLFLE